MVEPRRLVGLLCAAVSEGTEHTLRDDGTDLSSSSTDTVRGRAIPGWEALPGHNERGCVWPEIEEELSYHIETQQAIVGVLKFVITKADCNEEDCQNPEAYQLDRLASQCIDGRNGHPVARNCTGTDQNKISHGIAIEYFIDVMSAGPSNSREDDRVIETKPIECY